MRNPFRRQTETAAPSLHERAAALREGLSRQSTPPPAPVERADLYDSLLAAYAEEREARPISGRDGDETARRAANLVIGRAWALAREVAAMPPPATLDGLRATALASAILSECQLDPGDDDTLAAVGLTRAALAVTGTPLPPGFVGFGDEPDYKQRDRALFDPPGSLPAWAIAEIEAEDADDDDVLEATPEAPVDLSTAILDGWAAWGATLGKPLDDAEANAAWEQASAHRDRLLYAAMALPATHDSIAAKALACAWMEWVNIERPGQPRYAYGPADQLVYDINATIMTRDTAGTRPVELSSSALVPTVDFTGSTIRQLWAIREAASLVCDVSNAKTWQGCNRLPDHPTGAAMHNEAGKLMRWVSDAMCHVAGEAEKEARRRTPENSDDRGTRLVMLAGITVDNEDPAEIAAFARELLAMVES